MSANGTLISPNHEGGKAQETAAQDVKFTALTNGNDANGAHGEETSRTDSFKQEKAKWSARGERIKSKILFPSRALSNPKVRRSLSRGQRSEASGSSQHEPEGVRANGLDGSTTHDAGSVASSSKRLVLEDASPGRSSARDSTTSAGTSGVWSGQAGTLSGDHGKANARQPSMDPAQLVQMALNLSESRRRHALHPGTPAAASQIANLRQASGSEQTAQQNAVISGSAGLRNSMGTDAANARRSMQVNANMPAQDVDDNLPDDFYKFSPATLARAEKARRYFELADKHRRLLTYLPPLGPDHHVFGHVKRDSISGIGRSRAGTSNTHRSQADNQQRHYNPLQALRNRRTRQREKIALHPPPEHFRDMDRVEKWLEGVAAASSGGDRLAENQLPPISDIGGVPTETAGTKGHKRVNTADTVLSKIDHEWSIEPSELLADTYWTEQGTNKLLLENRLNRKLYGRAAPRRPSSVTDAESTIERIRRDSNTDLSAGEKPSSGHRHFIPLTAANRVRQNRLTRLGRSASVSSSSSTEARARVPREADADFVDIGPLRKHMNTMIRDDARLESSPLSEKSPDHWDSMHTRFHRGSVSEHREHRSRNHRDTPYSSPLQTHGEESNEGLHNSTTAILSSAESSRPPSPTAFAASRMQMKPLPEAVNQRSKFPSFRTRSRERVTDDDGIDAGHVARSSNDDARPIDPTRLSVEAARPAVMRRHKTSDSTSSSFHHTNSWRKTEDGQSTKDPASAVGRFLRGGRIGDMVRNESSKISSRIRGRERTGDKSPMNGSAVNSEASEDESGIRKSARSRDASPNGSPERPTNKSRFYTANLPSFKSPAYKDGATLKPIISNEEDDHIGRQQAALRSRNRSPRFEKLAPPRINLPASDDDGQISRPALHSDKSDVFDERRKSYGFLNAARNRSRSHSNNRGPARSIYTSNTELTKPDPNSDAPQSSPADHRHWSISQRRASTKQEAEEGKVNSRDIARVKTLLLASGIKAYQITRRLNAPPPAYPTFLLDTASVVNLPEKSLATKLRKETPRYAADLLSTFIDDHVRSLQHDLDTCQSEALQNLIAKQEKLKNRVAEDLTDLVHNASDQADAFNVEVSTHATMRTKQVADSIDAVLRLRRRQFRLVRLAAFKLLEWTVLVSLWWVWFVVICFKTVRAVFLAVFRFVRWLFSF